MKITAQIKTEARKMPGTNQYIIIVGHDESGNEVRNTKLTGFTLKDAGELRAIIEKLWNTPQETATFDRLTHSRKEIMS